MASPETSRSFHMPSVLRKLGRALDSPRDLSILVAAHLLEGCFVVPGMGLHLCFMAPHLTLNGPLFVVVLTMPMVATLMRFPFVLMMYYDCMKLVEEGSRAPQQIVDPMARLWREFFCVCPGASSAISLLYSLAFFYLMLPRQGVELDEKAAPRMISLPFLAAAVAHAALSGFSMVPVLAAGASGSLDGSRRAAQATSRAARPKYVEERVAARGDTCAICLTDFAQGEKIARLLCGHPFHRPCIDRWLLEDGRCPMRCEPERQRSTTSARAAAAPAAGAVGSSAPDLERGIAVQA